MKTFVHEVLRRSRTSTGVLQTALCYLEAEQAGSQREEEECDIVSISEDVPSNITSVPPNLSPLPPLPPLPSPLLSSWLAPREIGRCERAVGDALGWRLWVGKGMSTSTAGGNANGGRTVTRSRSDGDLLNGPSNRTAVWSSPAAEDPTGASCRHSRCDHPAAALPTPAQTPASRSRRLCRCATEPAIVHGLACASTSHAPRFPSRSAAPLAGIVEDCEMFLVEPCATPAATVDAQQDEDFSPSMLTPTLSYSPMSTASSASSDSSGDRTIQMSAFADLPTPSLTSFAYAHYSGVWDNSGIVDSNFNSVSWQAKGKATLDGMMTQMEDVSPGPTSATINTSETRRLPYSLPSLSDTVSLAPNHDGLYNCWTK
ncbi:hypothetical protein B0H21DRAFT_727384 [Amylocystis lapponica]|nr:hypothetical protein B0H21DRAFT_727384 [Amylocystis lapponica]